METFKEPLSLDEEMSCLIKLKNGDEIARNMLIEHNLRLVAHIVKKYYLVDADMEDLLSIGTVGLIKAVNTFDLNKGRLCTYASKCIENEILMYIRAEKKKNKEVSLYDPIGTDKEGNEISLIDIVEVNEKGMFEDYLLNHDIKWLYEVIGKVLNKRELEIISKRYGLFGEQEITQIQIAKQMNISRSYVSRIEKKALSKLLKAYS